jgi:hypothetical protein
LRQVSLDRTAKTRQLLEMAENDKMLKMAENAGLSRLSR